MTYRKVITPMEFYNEPKEVLKDSFLTKNEKEKALFNWKSEILHILESENEGMEKKAKIVSLDSIDSAIRSLSHL